MSTSAVFKNPCASKEFTWDEEQYIAWVLAMLRQKKPSSASEIALQAVRMAGAELLGEAPVAARKKQKAG